MKRLFLFSCLFSLWSLPLWAQFPPAAGQPGSTAIPADSPLLINWAQSCTIDRGSINTSDPEAPLASLGDAENATGELDNLVVSLGDGGQATLYFNPPIRNGEGWDFAVFENGFSDTFLELAIVEVSTDGWDYIPFESTSFTPTDEQVGPFGAIQATQLNNLAGKYRAGFGTPFDLEELGLEEIAYVRLTDVVGSIAPDWGTSDSQDQLINDPFPTPFESCGFDLDGIGVFHEGVFNSTKEANQGSRAIQLFPNPVAFSHPIVIVASEPASCRCYSNIGQLLSVVPIQKGEQIIDLPRTSTGPFYLHCQTQTGQQWQKRILLFD
jgi:hypothetical protein